MKTVLFACIHNAGRSQMAAAWFNALADEHKARGISAGTDPGTRVHPEVLSAMREVGIELEGVEPRKLTDGLAGTATILVTMGCGEACPVVPGLRRMDWPLEDPKGKTVERVREIRDEVRSHVVKLLASEGWGRPSTTQAPDLNQSSRFANYFGKSEALVGSNVLEGQPSLARRIASEAVGTALLLAVVVGSGIMGERLSGGNVAIALLANTLATGAGLVALILTFGPISGAHFNPAVTVADATQGGIAWRDVPGYLAAQTVGAFVGVAAADAMFAEPIFSASRHTRSTPPELLSEFIATFGLMAVIWGCSRQRSSTVVPFAVGAYITAAYWFTASTSFANPAVTLARSATNTFAGIRPVDAPAFIVAQILGAIAATWLFRWLVPTLPTTADRVLAPHKGPVEAEPGDKNLRPDRPLD